MTTKQKSTIVIITAVLIALVISASGYVPGGRARMHPTDEAAPAQNSADDDGDPVATATPAWNPTEAAYYTEVAEWATFQASDDYEDWFATWAAPNVTPPPPYPGPVEPVEPLPYPYPEP